MTDEQEPPKSKLNWPERQEFYSSVGQGISLWASMENKLVEIAAILLGTSETKAGLMFFSISNFHVWLNTIDELFKLETSFQQFRPEWGALSDTLRQLNDTRVRLAHHTVWDTQEQTLALRPAIYDARSKSRKYAPLTNPEIISFLNKTLDTDEKIFALITTMSSPKSWPQISFEQLLGPPPKEGAQ